MLRKDQLKAEKEIIQRVLPFGSVMCKSVSIRVTTLLCGLLFVPICQAFLPNFWSRVLTLSWDSSTHQYMTEQAILNITMETLSTIMEQAQGGDKEELHTRLGRGFWHAVGEVASANAAMDFLSSTRSDPIYHFDSERVDGATEMLRDFWSQTLLLTKSKEYQGARRSLGQLFHSLQDFYSHSNWVEMGKQDVYLHLLHPEESAVPVASEDIPTCAACYRFTCYNNLLEEMIRGETEPLLTTGYFSGFPDKPAGKCSHGGILDSSRHHGAEGGINKDSRSPLFSPHHYLHKEAARLAATATLRVLQDLREEVGPKSFLSLFSVQQPPALVFVMDTTGSMFEEITAARLRAFSIIQARERSRRTILPGTFIMVPFHDPDFGPVKETDSPDEFMLYMENLLALGGGDEPEMCLSALQLALTHSPPLSEIFVFTDASPKDHHLQSAVQALILEKQIKVNFLLTEDPSLTSRGRLLRKRRETLSPDRFSLYSSLSSVSGGMTIFTTNKDIHKVSAIVEDTTTSSKVTLLHVESEMDSLNSFRVDGGVENVKLHITGQITHCELISPSGSRQFLPGSDGPLAELVSSQGLFRICLLAPLETGVWQLVMRAIGPVSFNVQGDSSLDFLFYFAKEANETHPGLRKVEGSPIAGTAVFLVVAVTGLSPNEEASFSHVTLLGPSGESLLKVLLNSSSSHWSEEELVGHMVSVPIMPFSLRLSGTDGRGNLLDRVSSEMIQPTHVQIQVLSAPNLLQGQSSTVMFEISNHGPDRHFVLSAEEEYGYLSHTEQHRNKLFIAERSSVKREIELNTPHNAETKRPITLTLTVQAEDSPDSNYAVVYLTVIHKERDTSPPACSALRVESACPAACSQGSWKVSLTVRDRGHSGLASVQLAQGEGILTLSQVTTVRNRKLFPQRHETATVAGHLKLDKSQPFQTESGHESQRRIQLVNGDAPTKISEGSEGKPIMMVYSSGCCAPRAELVLLDRAGNMRRCHLIASQQRALREKNNARNERSQPLLVLTLYHLLIWSILHTLQLL